MSGPGKHIVFGRNGQGFWGSIYNFNTGSSALKAEHKTFLGGKVCDVLRGGGSIRLIGLASRLGNPDSNRTLSMARVTTTLQWLREQVRNNFRATLVTCEGEDAAANTGVDDGDDDESWRSVNFSVWTLATPPPPPPPTRRRPRPDKKPRLNRLAIRQLAAGSLDILGPLSVQGADFQIVNFASRRTAYYRFQGLGLGVGALPMSGAMQGPWNQFTIRTAELVTSHIDPGEFGGRAEWASISAFGSLGNTPEYTRLWLRDPPLTPFSVAISPFNGGLSVDAGIGIVAGVFLKVYETVSFPGPVGGL
jgi:hypothetical protein